MIVEDLAWMQKKLPDKLMSLPPPSSETAAWVDLITRFPKEWKMMVCLVCDSQNDPVAEIGETRKKGKNQCSAYF